MCKIITKLNVFLFSIVVITIISSASAGKKKQIATDVPPRKNRFSSYHRKQAVDDVTKESDIPTTNKPDITEAPKTTEAPDSKNEDKTELTTITTSKPKGIYSNIVSTLQNIKDSAISIVSPKNRYKGRHNEQLDTLQHIKDQAVALVTSNVDKAVAMFNQVKDKATAMVSGRQKGQKNEIKNHLRTFAFMVPYWDGLIDALKAVYRFALSLTSNLGHVITPVLAKILSDMIAARNDADDIGDVLEITRDKRKYKKRRRM